MSLVINDGITSPSNTIINVYSRQYSYNSNISQLLATIELSPNSVKGSTALTTSINTIDLNDLDLIYLTLSNDLLLCDFTIAMNIVYL